MARSSAPQAVRSLYNILVQERDRGFDNRTVIGGLDEFLGRFGADLERYLGDEPPYGRLSAEERSQWADRVVGRLRGQTSLRPDTTSPQDIEPHPQPPRARTVSRQSAAGDRSLRLSDSVGTMSRVGQRLMARLEALGVHTINDLVHLYPKRHADFTSVKRVADLRPGEEQTAILTVWDANQTMLGRQKSTQAVLGDDTGNIRAVWFNNPWVADRLRPGAQVVLSGKLSVFRGNLVFQAPEYEMLDGNEGLVHTGRLVPVYPSTQGLTQRVLRSLARRALDACLQQVEEFLPIDILHRADLIGLRNAVEQMHYPEEWDGFRAARRRLAFDELFLQQMSVLERRQVWKEEGRGVPVMVDSTVVESFVDSLPFHLTGAQTAAVREILDDIQTSRPMSRLLQGDVGSGKTVVATVGMLATVYSGHQVGLMAPTEILAEQHFLTVCRLLTGSGFEPASGPIQRLEVPGSLNNVTVALLLGGQRKRERDDIRALLAAGQVDIVVGTHALIQEGVDIPNLGFAVVDEQHRFGVSQRAALRDKGVRPHFLAMSATPIPRSLALTLYGDLDVSVIDELPPGRQPIRTRFVAEDRRDAAYAFVADELEAGRQAFVVCPLIDGSETIQTSAAKEEYERLSATVFPDRSVGLLHGRMSLQQKEEVLDSFRSGNLDILVSTPVVEVGIDVPNATVMLIDGAERFGLSQLHQFRGRVGRGAYQSHCLLLSDSPGPEALRRLKLLERVSDGFQLSEEDLKIRGPGDYFGTRQSGIPSFRVAEITDQQILSVARREATRVLAVDPELSAPEYSSLASVFGDFRRALVSERS